eukprot:TRINITY_DN7223_c0_g1_i1.p1 TRINITY_DN7223_c0_g1~~TRINITY_DN7223_c0_g1_i1.p1  ORF type:complete len:383 (+),score=133.31 TRINITY_DN7223_c0_g1_i1:63-1211(+)
MLSVLPLAAAAGAWNAFIGGAGCDVADTSCVHPAAVTDVQDVVLSGQALRYERSTKVGDHPTWLTAGQPTREYPVVYAALTAENKVAALKVGDGAVPELTTIGTGATKGIAPVHTSVDRTGAFLMVANYGGCDNCTGPDGAVSVLPIKADGSVGDAVFNLTHHGHGVNPQRQGCAHVHSAVASPHGDVVYVQDLGLDLVFAYAIDLHTGALSLISTVNSSRPGAGPRHMAVHPSKLMTYVVEEMGNTVSAYRIGADGGLSHVQSLPTTDLVGGKAAEIVINPTGTTLFVSNRGMCDGCDSVQVYGVAADGTLQRKGAQQTVHAHFPRGMALSPDGDLLLVAGQGDGSLSTFAVDADGKLQPRDRVTGLTTPATIAFPQSRQS